MRAQEAVTLSGLSAGATAAFELRGGTYNVLATSGSWGTGNANLQTLGPDGTTWLDHFATPFSANGLKEATSFNPGQYRVNVTGNSTGVAITVARVPSE